MSARRDPKTMDDGDLASAIIMKADWFENFGDRDAMEQMYEILYNEEEPTIESSEIKADTGGESSAAIADATPIVHEGEDNAAVAAADDDDDVDDNNDNNIKNLIKGINDAARLSSDSDGEVEAGGGGDDEDSAKVKKEEEEEVDPSHFEAVGRLADMTAKPFDECLKILKRYNWDYERAVMSAMADELGPSEPPSPPSFRSGGAGGGGGVHSLRPPSLPTYPSQSGQRSPNFPSHGGPFGQRFGGIPNLEDNSHKLKNPFIDDDFLPNVGPDDSDNYNNNDDDDDDDGNEVELDDNGNPYRRRDRVRRQNLNEDGFGVEMSRTPSNGHWEQSFKNDAPGVTWAVPLSAMSSNFGYEDTMDICKNENKFLLVNIQNHENDESIGLNRSLHHNPHRRHARLCKLIHDRFLLFQRGHTSEDAQSFLRGHRLDEFDLPFFSLIHPITGANLREWGMKLKSNLSYPDKLADILESFLETASVRPKPIWPAHISPNMNSVNGSSSNSSNSSNDSNSNNSNNSSNSSNNNNSSGTSSSNSSYPSSPSSTDKTPSTVVAREVQAAIGSPQDPTKPQFLEDTKKEANIASPAIEPTPTVDYGPVLSEPPDSEPNICRLKVQFGGKRHTRSFRKSDSARGIFAWVSSLVVDTEKNPAQQAKLELSFGFPPINLDEMEKPIGQIPNLANSSLTIKLL